MRFEQARHQAGDGGMQRSVDRKRSLAEKREDSREADPRIIGNVEERRLAYMQRFRE